MNIYYVCNGANLIFCDLTSNLAVGEEKRGFHVKMQFCRNDLFCKCAAT